MQSSSAFWHTEKSAYFCGHSEAQSFRYGHHFMTTRHLTPHVPSFSYFYLYLWDLFFIYGTTAEHYEFQSVHCSIITHTHTHTWRKHTHTQTWRKHTHTWRKQKIYRVGSHHSSHIESVPNMEAPLPVHGFRGTPAETSMMKSISLKAGFCLMKKRTTTLLVTAGVTYLFIYSTSFPSAHISLFYSFSCLCHEEGTTPSYSEIFQKLGNSQELDMDLFPPKPSPCQRCN